MTLPKSPSFKVPALRSFPKEEFLGIKETPKNILQFRAAIFGGLEACCECLQLFLKWSASERGPIQFFDYLPIRFARIEQTTDAVLLFSEQFTNIGPADHLEGLRHVALAG